MIINNYIPTEEIFSYPSDIDTENKKQLADTIAAMARSYFPEFLDEPFTVSPCGNCATDSVKTNTPFFQSAFMTDLDFIKALENVHSLFIDPYEINSSSGDTIHEQQQGIVQKAYENSDSGFSGIVTPSSDIGLLDSHHDYFDVCIIRKDFPILNEKINGNSLIWFDNAATTQKPRRVTERLKYFYEHENSNIHRSAHTLAARTTDAYEGARNKMASFLNAKSSDEIVFVRSTTEGINLVAQTYGIQNLKENDEVIVTLLEHHANIVPWQMACARTGAKLKAASVDDSGQVDLTEYEKLFSQKTKIVALTHVSNALGTITPVMDMINIAHRYGAKVLIDGAQAVSHLRVDVTALDCDFYVFSGHKIYGPTGIGVLYGKKKLLDSMQPYQGGGGMISDVTFDETSYKAPPQRFEAGTGSIADAIGLGSAIDYLTGLGLERVFSYEQQLYEYAEASLKQIPTITLIGTALKKTSILSFLIKGLEAEEAGKVLNDEGIAVRTGHHCSQPILRRFGLESTIRASLAFYNTFEEVDYFISVLRKIINYRSIGSS